jgi:hypothetical protein
LHAHKFFGRPAALRTCIAFGTRRGRPQPVLPPGVRTAREMLSKHGRSALATPVVAWSQGRDPAGISHCIALDRWCKDVRSQIFITLAEVLAHRLSILPCRPGPTVLNKASISSISVSSRPASRIFF